MLRYDKRTYAYQTLDPQKTTVEEEVIDDGVAAVKLLRARHEVAHDRIFVIGHSLGAIMAPEIARKASAGCWNRDAGADRVASCLP